MYFYNDCRGRPCSCRHIWFYLRVVVSGVGAASAHSSFHFDRSFAVFRLRFSFFRRSGFSVYHFSGSLGGGWRIGYFYTFSSMIFFFFIDF